MADNGITLETSPIPCMSLEQKKPLGTVKTCNVNTRDAWNLILQVPGDRHTENHNARRKKMEGISMSVTMEIRYDIRNTLTENILQDIF